MKARNDNTLAGSLAARREGRAMPASTAISGFAPLRTARLVLRPVEAADADAVFTRFSHWSIVQWLSSPPWPNRREDTAAFIARCADGQAAGLDVTLAIEMAGNVIGVIDWRQFPASDLQAGPGPRVGYWLAEEFWGRGLMSEAAGALCDHIFAVTDEPTIYSGAFAGNAPSLRVQAKLGFEVAGETTLFSRPQQKDLPHVNTVLTRAARTAVLADAPKVKR